MLTLRMTQNITKAINEDEKIMMETAALFISICYAPWFLKSYMVNKAPSNDLSASGIITQGSGRLCLPAFSAIAGICLSIWFCWLLLMMT
jgi:hypothetical protein